MAKSLSLSAFYPVFYSFRMYIPYNSIAHVSRMARTELNRPSCNMIDLGSGRMLVFINLLLLAGPHQRTLRNSISTQSNKFRI